MKGLIMEIRGLQAIALFPGGEMRSLLRRHGWRPGMIVDPYAVRSGGFVRAATAMGAVLVLALGIFGYQMIGSHGADNVATRPSERSELTLPDPNPESEGFSIASATPTPSPAIEPSAEPSFIPTAVPDPANTGHHDSRHHSSRLHEDGDDDRYEICDECGEMGHDDDDHCDFCGVIGHGDDDCPLLPEGWDPDPCDYCGLYGHDDDHCPAAPPGWDD